MPIAHTCAAGMGGMRAAGDLVARLQMAKGMRLAEAKRALADALGVSIRDLSDNQIMHEVRGELRLGRVIEAEVDSSRDPSPLEAKLNIETLLGLELSGLRGLRARVGQPGGAGARPAVTKQGMKRRTGGERSSSSSS
jgi:dimethylamine---corrinoid protein Co-methyltransferase